MSQFQHPEMCETSFLLSENLCNFLYPELPTLVQGLSWVLLYSTRRHGFSLRTLYRRSTFCPGPCLLVARDAEGTILGGLLEAPLQPSTRKRYQGTNNTFVFTNVSGKPDIFRPTEQGISKISKTFQKFFKAVKGKRTRVFQTQTKISIHFSSHFQGDRL
ncbi:uncharacterized protein LOC131069594 isoform X4 [Cryptomeria japonica]|uniref:uncharacterized protein LOC131069594 isoform X4 n=1 Tax=Cryptomeria japonica TaxID=3369 RepID=UPI0027DAA63E|nr:uncharacterized protein LOC131069594 isoform X4 [Cryptomeria japonica]